MGVRVALAKKGVGFVFRGCIGVGCDRIKTLDGLLHFALQQMHVAHADLDIDHQVRVGACLEQLLVGRLGLVVILLFLQRDTPCVQRVTSQRGTRDVVQFHHRVVGLDGFVQFTERVLGFASIKVRPVE